MIPKPGCIASNQREVFGPRQDALNEALARLAQSLPGQHHIGTFRNEPDCNIHTMLWEFPDGRIYKIDECDAPHLLQIIEKLIDRIRYFEGEEDKRKALEVLK